MKNTLETLIEGLEGQDFRAYVDLLVSNMNPKLDNWEEYCFWPNDDEHLRMIIDNTYEDMTHIISYFVDANYDVDADFIHPSDLTTIYYSDLREIYINLFTNLEEYGIEFFLEILEDIEDEIIELNQE